MPLKHCSRRQPSSPPRIVLVVLKTTFPIIALAKCFNSSQPKVKEKTAVCQIARLRRFFPKTYLAFLNIPFMRSKKRKISCLFVLWIKTERQQQSFLKCYLKTLHVKVILRWVLKYSVQCVNGSCCSLLATTCLASNNGKIPFL